LIAAVMCGGKSTRMKTGIEKPLIKINRVAMVQYVLSALSGSSRLHNIFAVVSPNAPKTKEFMKSKGLEIIETPGNGFSQDLVFLSKFSPKRVLVVPADLPLLDAKIVNEIASISQVAPAVSIAMEKDFIESIGIKPSTVFNRYCHSGITIFDTAKIGDGPVEEQYIIMNRIEIAVNVNTKEETEIAEKLLVQHT